MNNRSYFLTIYGFCMLLVLANTSATAADAEKKANPYKGPEFRHLHALYEYPYRGSKHVVR